ncbi:MAG: squalene/phytoene synthase family protein [Planctomycetes bacterium]|nr:squalene/phytoene synthase family protein [Planctomycetota bacterium]
MHRRALFKDLDRLARGVSRSFYLTLRIAPRAVRGQLVCGYLFCRAADTIADTRILPAAERLDLLRLYRAQLEREEPIAADLDRIRGAVAGASQVPEERELLERLDACFAAYLRFDVADRILLRRLVTTLTRGMEMDLERFPPEESGDVASLETAGDLDLYCYHVAGCVGEFWTDLECAHLRALRRWDVDRYREKGVRFGKGLQMTNILRDVDGDLRIGRCYLPRADLEEIGLTARELRDRSDRSALRPAIHRWIRRTLEHYREGWDYTLAIPRRLVALRLACIWPLWIGLSTLELLAAAADPCAPGVVIRIPQSAVWSLMRASVVRAFSSRALDRVYRRLEGQVEDALEG